MMDYQGPPRVAASIVAIVVQLLAIAGLSAVPFFIVAVIPNPGPTIGSIRVLAGILLMLNCMTVRFMNARVIAWAGVGLNLLLTALLAVLLKIRPKQNAVMNPYLPRFEDTVLTSVLIGISASTVLLMVIFQMIYRRGSLFTLCTGDIDSINIDENDYLEYNGELLRLQNVKPTRLIHTQCGPGIVPAWLLRLISVGYLPMSIFFVLLSLFASNNSSGANDQNFIDMTHAISQLYLEQAIALFVWSICSLFIAFRFSSRRRLCLFIFIGFIVIIYSMVNFFYINTLMSLFPKRGTFYPGFLVAVAGITAAWNAMAAWAISYREIFDNSCCLCFIANTEGLGHCVVA